MIHAKKSVYRSHDSCKANEYPKRLERAEMGRSLFSNQVAPGINTFDLRSRVEAILALADPIEGLIVVGADTLRSLIKVSEGEQETGVLQLIRCKGL